MAHTYTSLPIAVPSLFQTLVTEVSDNLSSELGTDVQFIHGTWLHINERLTAKDSSKYLKNIKYPLVALIHDFNETYRPDSKYFDVDLTLLICVDTTGDMYSEDRYTNNYIPKLYPIYAELMQRISSSNAFKGYFNGYPEHTKVDDLHMGTDADEGNRGYKLPDKLDGIWIKNLKLTINSARCITSTISIPSVSLEYYNVIQSVTLSLSGSTITVNATGDNYTDGSLSPVPIYTIDWGFGSPESIDMGVDISKDYSAQADGTYTGQVLCNDGITIASLSFMVVVSGGFVIERTISNEIDFGTIGQSVGYPLSIITQYVHSKDAMTALNLVQVLPLTTIDSNTYTAPIADSGTITGTYLAGASASQRTIKQELTVSGNALNSNIKFILNT